MAALAPLWGIGQGRIDAQRWLHHVFAQDVRKLDRLGRRRNVLCVERREDRVLIEDVVELTFQARQLLLGQTEAREMGDVLYVGTGQRSHARDDTGRGGF